MPRPAPTRRILLEIALDKPEYKSGDTMNVAVTARSDGRVTLNVVGDRMLATVNADVKTGLNQLKVPVGQNWGNGAYVVATLAPSARCGGQADAGPRDRRAMVLGRQGRAHAVDGDDAAAGDPAELDACGCRSSLPVSMPGRRRASSSPRSMSAFSI